jgi:hypothetical protein
MSHERRQAALEALDDHLHQGIPLVNAVQAALRRNQLNDNLADLLQVANDLWDLRSMRSQP